MRGESGLSGPGYRTRTCSFWLQGRCRKGDACTFLHATTSDNAEGPNSGTDSTWRSSTRAQRTVSARGAAGPSRTPSSAASTDTRSISSLPQGTQDPKAKFRSLARITDQLCGPRAYQELFGAALKLMDQTDESESALVVEALGGSPPDGTDKARKHVQTLITQALVLGAPNGNSSTQVCACSRTHCVNYPAQAILGFHRLLCTHFTCQ